MATLRKFEDLPLSTEPTFRQKKKKGFARKAGDFLAPTATSLLTKEKKLTPRTGLGALLEIGSFAIPSTAILRGAGFAGRAARAASVASKAKKASPLTTRSILETAKQTGKTFGKKTKEGALIGGATGTTFGAGISLGQEDLTLPQVAGEALKFGAIGAGLGAATVPAISFAAMGIRGLAGFSSKAYRNTLQKINPADRTQVIENVTDARMAMVVEDAAAVNKQGDKLVRKYRNRGGPDSFRGYVKEVSTDGYIPKVEGVLGKEFGNLADLDTRIGKHAKQREPFLEAVTTKTSTKDFKKRVQDFLAEAEGLDEKLKSQVNAIFDSVQKNKDFGRSLSAVQVGRLQTEMNIKSRAFGGKTFNIDAQFAVAHIAREIVDEITKSKTVRGINAEMARLFRMKETLNIFDNRKLKVDAISQAMGRLLGLSVLSAPIAVGLGAVSGAVGLGIATGGSLFIAGIAAHLGANFVAKIVRNSRFNPQVMQQLRQGMNTDKVLLNKLMKEATGEDKAILQRVFGNQRKRSAIIPTATTNKKTTIGRNSKNKNKPISSFGKKK